MLFDLNYTLSRSKEKYKGSVCKLQIFLEIVYKTMYLFSKRVFCAILFFLFFFFADGKVTNLHTIVLKTMQLVKLGTGFTMITL